jgi:hypothetical protein
MAGQPRKKAMVTELTRRANRKDITVLEYAVEWVESGKTLAQLVADINAKLGLDENEDGVTRSMIYRYLSKELDGAEALAQARSEGSHGMAESAVEIIDRPAENKVEAAQRKTQAEIRLKLAGFWNRAEYGEQKGANVQVNLDMGQLHLDAMRQRVMPSMTQPVLPPAGPDVEIVPASEGEPPAAVSDV